MQVETLKLPPEGLLSDFSSNQKGIFLYYPHFGQRENKMKLALPVLLYFTSNAFLKSLS